MAGSYPSLLNGPSGDGVLAYVLFAFHQGQENNNPGFRIADAATSEAVPEPATIALTVGALLMLAGVRNVRAGTSRRQSKRLTPKHTATTGG